MTDQKYTKELEAFEDAMKERWCQLKGYWDHPRLEQPLALPDDCDKCHVNLKLFFNDCKKHMAFQLTAVTKQRDEAIKLCSDLIAGNAALKNSRDELREALIIAQEALMILRSNYECTGDDYQGTASFALPVITKVLTKTKEGV